MLMPIKKSLELAAKNTCPFHFFISGIGVFRSIYHPRVLWLGLKDTNGLQDLKAKTDQTLSPILKIDPNEKYHPHLTIGRMKKINDSKLLEKVMNEYQNRDFLKVDVEEIVYYESVLFPEGPVYQILSEHTLNESIRLHGP
jgi:2'-5' RNA ligase